MLNNNFTYIPIHSGSVITVYNILIKNKQIEDNYDDHVIHFYIGIKYKLARDHHKMIEHLIKSNEKSKTIDAAYLLYQHYGWDRNSHMVIKYCHIIIDKYNDGQKDEETETKVTNVYHSMYSHYYILNDIKNILHYGPISMKLFKNKCGFDSGVMIQGVNDLITKNFDCKLALAFYDYLYDYNKKRLVLSLDYWRDYDYIDLTIRQSIDTIVELDIPSEIVQLIYNNLIQIKS